MNRPASSLSARVVDRIANVPAAAWDACAVGDGPAGGGPENPFVSHAFLDALEQSGSVGRKAGWLPQHLVIEDSAGIVLAAAPLYVKSHSQGEYVFDHGWAEAYDRAGGRYYPKLQVAAPFTPVPGPRLLVR
ncbi:MAG TPA: peptidogalycan biosysnthesis protein, partial [Dongiaceae bacterium]|nr:peptidogalycan biosysnthesis protein [Dongiaceae bacterium]